MTGSIDDLLRVTEAFRAARPEKPLSEARLSMLMFNDGKRLGMLRSGGDVGSRRLPALFQWLSDHWPEGASWPIEVDRPVVAPATVDAEPAEVAA